MMTRVYRKTARYLPRDMRLCETSEVASFFLERSSCFDERRKDDTWNHAVFRFETPIEVSMPLLLYARDRCSFGK